MGEVTLLDGYVSPDELLDWIEKVKEAAKEEKQK